MGAPRAVGHLDVAPVREEDGGGTQVVHGRHEDLAVGAVLVAERDVEVGAAVGDLVLLVVHPGQHRLKEAEA